MDDLDERHDIGANNPPGKVELERAAELVDTATTWVIERPEITDPEMAKEANELIAKLKGARKELAGAQKIEVAPLDTAIDDIKAKYKEPTTKIDAAVAMLAGRAGVWLTKEKERIAAEQAAAAAEARRIREEAERAERDRLAAQRKLDEERRQMAEDQERRRLEAEQQGGQTELEKVAEEARVQAESERVEAERQAAARAAAEAEEKGKAAREAERVAARKPQTAAIRTGAVGSRAMTLRTYWSAVITDEESAYLSYADHPTVVKARNAAVLQAANEDARAKKDATAAPPGVKFTSDERPV